MDPAAVERAARFLLDLRRSRRLADGLPQHCQPVTVEEAYAVQDRLFELLDEPTGGWFLGCTNPEIQRQLGLDDPYCARLLESSIHTSPAVIDIPSPLSAVLEVEFAFTLGRDLPPRSAPYDEDEVAGAVATVHPAIEVVISYFVDWTNQPITSLVADNGTDGALVYAEGVEDWQGVDLSSLATSLSVNGRDMREGRGANVLNGPLSALMWLANARSRHGDGLHAGQIHNTGSSTSMYFASPGDVAVADFGPLGTVSLEISCSEEITRPPI